MDGYRYPITELRGDYFRAGAGMAFLGYYLSVPVRYLSGSLLLAAYFCCF